MTDILFPVPFSGDIIIKEGTIGSKMYFIQEGIVDIVMANGEVSNFLIFPLKFLQLFSHQFRLQHHYQMARILVKYVF